MYKKIPSFYITHLIFLRVCVRLKTLGGEELTQSLFSSTSDNAPPHLALCQAFLSLS